MATAAGELECNNIIHTVGPIYNRRLSEKQNYNRLFKAIYSTLMCAKDLGCRSISIPAISAGIYRYPVDLCAMVILDAIEQFVMDHHTRYYSLESIRIVL